MTTDREHLSDSELSTEIKDLIQEGGDLDLIRGLVEELRKRNGSDLKRRLQDRLNTACWYGRSDVVAYFVEEAGTDVEWRDSEGDTALHNACYLHETASLDVVKYLVRMAGSNVNARNSCDQTPLHYACSPPRLDIAEFLVEEAGANPNLLDVDGCPPLLFAVGRGHAHDLSRYLIPRTTLTGEIFKEAWGSDWEGDVPTDIKQLFVVTFGRQQVPQHSADYWTRFLLHAAFHTPLPSQKAALEFVGLCGSAMLSYLDCDGRLPIHAAIETSTGGNISAESNASIIVKLMRLEPRSAFVRDPITRLYPFQMAAAATIPKIEGAKVSGKDTETRSDDDDRHYLTLVYELLRQNPEQLMPTSRLHC